MVSRMKVHERKTWSEIETTLDDVHKILAAATEDWR